MLCRCIFARRKEVLESVKAECLAAGLSADRIICVIGDVTSTKDLSKLREEVVKGTSAYSLFTICLSCEMVWLIQSSMGWSRYTSYSRRCAVDIYAHAAHRHEDGECGDEC